MESRRRRIFAWKLDLIITWCDRTQMRKIYSHKMKSHQYKYQKYEFIDLNIKMTLVIISYVATIN
jgi:hypothetical protein